MSCHSRVIAQRQVDVSPLCHCCATVESVAASFQRHFAIFDDNILSISLKYLRLKMLWSAPMVLNRVALIHMLLVEIVLYVTNQRQNTDIGYHVTLPEQYTTCLLYFARKRKVTKFARVMKRDIM